MLNHKIKQRGFDVIQRLFIAVVVGVIASVAFLTYSRYQMAHQVKRTSNAASSTSTDIW